MPRRQPFRLDQGQWLAVHSIRQLPEHRWPAVTLALNLTGLGAGSGAPGGLFAPMLTLGGTIGLACGGLAEQLTGRSPTRFVFAGMGAFVAGGSRIPITAMFLAFTLTKNLLILKPILVTCLLSFLVALQLREGHTPRSPLVPIALAAGPADANPADVAER